AAPPQRDRARSRPPDRGADLPVHGRHAHAHRPLREEKRPSTVRAGATFTRCSSEQSRRRQLCSGSVARRSATLQSRPRATKMAKRVARKPSASRAVKRSNDRRLAVGTVVERAASSTGTPVVVILIASAGTSRSREARRRPVAASRAGRALLSWLGLAASGRAHRLMPRYGSVAA